MHGTSGGQGGGPDRGENRCPTRFYSDVSAAPRIRWDELPFAIGVQAEPGGTPIGWATGGDWPEPADPPPEKRWRVRVGGHWLPGWYALRGGAFVELAEDA